MEKIGEKRKVWACGEKAALAAAKGFLEVAASAMGILARGGAASAQDFRGVRAFCGGQGTMKLAEEGSP
jgi:hypothetical protein